MENRLRILLLTGAISGLAGVAAILILLGAAPPALAQTDEHPAALAIIGTFDDGSGRDRAFEYLKQGAVLKLGAGGTALIRYFQSCILETIKGGVVTIGLEQSEIRGGIITRKQLDCDGSKFNLTPAEAWQWWLWPGSERNRWEKAR